jgi:putative peptide zinc metalloprotease protein
VDLGGVYFQSIAASLVCLIYLKTDFIPCLVVVIASDALCLFSINPLLKFDGYWLLTDILAVPNLQEYSERVMRNLVKGLFGRRPGSLAVGVKPHQALLLAAYAVIRNAFWLVLAVVVVLTSTRVYAGASATLSSLFSAFVEGINVSDWALAASSAIRATLFVLLLLTMISLLFGVGLKLARLGRMAAGKIRVWRLSDRALTGEITR